MILLVIMALCVVRNQAQTRVHIDLRHPVVGNKSARQGEKLLSKAMTAVAKL